ncbi:MAG: GxxExxY protein [Gemmatimonadales bacterium]
MYEHDPLTEVIIGCAFKVRHYLGAGLLESAYQTFLGHEFSRLNLCFVSQETFPVTYDGIEVKVGFRPDFVVDEKVIVELKTVTTILPIHKAQVLTYLRLTGIKTGLLINFHAMPFSSGINRLSL